MNDCPLCKVVGTRFCAFCAEDFIDWVLDETEMEPEVNEKEKELQQKARFEHFVSRSVLPSTVNEITDERHYYVRLFLFMFIPVVIGAAFLCFGKC